MPSPLATCHSPVATMVCNGRHSPLASRQYPIQKITDIYSKVTEEYNKLTELENSSWNVLSLLLYEVANIRTGHILP